MGTINQILLEYLPTPKNFLHEETAHVQSENTLLQQQFLQNYNVSVDYCIDKSNSGKWQSDNPSTCYESSSKEQSDLE